METLKQIFISIPNQQAKILEISNLTSVSQLKQTIDQKFSIANYSLFYENKQLRDIQAIKNLTTLFLNFQLIGGKGGFGSLLKAQACNIKATNTDASRDLEGRRMRNITNDESLRDFFRNKKKSENDLKFQQDEAKIHQKVQNDNEQQHKIYQEFFKKQEKWNNNLKGSIRKGLIAKVPKFEESENDFQVNKKVKFDEVDAIILDKQPAQQDDIFQKMFQSYNEKIEVKEIIDNQQNIKQQKLEFEQLDLTQFKNLEDLLNLGAEKLKQELIKLGLKCGGNLQERAQRLFDVKNDASCLFNPKYLAKSK